MSMADPASPDDRIGEYKYVRTLLQGQNSTVMEVEQEGTGRKFAMKQLLASRAKIPAERKLFEFEARLGKDLTHPNLIGVHEYVKDKKQPYFVMDYFPSTHMRLVIGKSNLFDEYRPKLHRIIEQAATGLAYMHSKGWVHRDVKPENIIVNKTGEVRVIDYALALKVPSGLAGLFTGKPPCQGTHSYMSPEQILRKPTSVTTTFIASGSPATSSPAAVSRSAPIPPMSCSTSTSASRRCHPPRSTRRSPRVRRTGPEDDQEEAGRPASGPPGIPEPVPSRPDLSRRPGPPVRLWLRSFVTARAVGQRGRNRPTRKVIDIGRHRATIGLGGSRPSRHRRPRDPLPDHPE